VTLDIEGSASYVRLTLSKDGTTISECILPNQKGSARTTFSLEDPDLWWPFTLGDQPLYTLTSTLLDESESNIVADTVTKTFGIRKIELIQRPIKDQDGSSFFFQINNVPLFAAGSCWIPADSFTPRITPQEYREWVRLARRGNQVMLRIWGGGIYEHDALYDACDEQGILVWQDFMFACGNYPAYPSILHSIELEAEQNIRRLRHHPCLAIWAGNNEDYLYHLIAGVHYDAEERDPQRWLTSAFPARYIYEHLLPKLCQRLIPDVPYTPGSPFGGSFANDPTVGDIHQWSVWHLEKRLYQDYADLSGRFVSEFGMQALPAAETIATYFHPHQSLADGDRAQKYVGSRIMTWHNKATGAHDTLAKYLAENIKYTADTLPEYIYATQLIQSEALATAYRSWRRLFRGPGREYCAGALVWQLNDCWPTTSWAVVDYWRRPKMGYWAVKRENRPLTVGLKRVKVADKANGCTAARALMMEAWATNFTLQQKVLDVTARAWDVGTGKQVWEGFLCRAAVLKANQSTELGGFSIPSVSDDGRSVVVAIYLSSPAPSADGLHVLARHVNFHEPLKEVPLQPEPAGLEIKICSEDPAGAGGQRHPGDVLAASRRLSRPADAVDWPRTIASASTSGGPSSLSDVDGATARTWVHLTAGVPVKGVWVDTNDNQCIEWDDNGVDLVPGETVRLGVRGLEVGEEKRLKVMWLGGGRGGEDLEGLRSVQGVRTASRCQYRL
jgi:beta-mannosidase